jgi:hypothetical protein
MHKPSNEKKVDLYCSLPSFPYWKDHMDEVVKMLRANGLSDIETLEVSESLKGGFSGANVKCKLTLKSDSKPFYVVLKGHSDDERSLLQKAYREAIFYYHMEPKLRHVFRMPYSFLSLADEKTGRFLQVSEYVDNSTMADVMYEHSVYKDTLNPNIDRAFTPYSVANQAFKSIANFHATRFMDREFCQ